MKILLELFAIWFLVFMVIMTVIGVGAGLGELMSRMSCTSLSEQTGLETKHDNWVACYVKTESQPWLTRTQYEGVLPTLIENNEF